MVGEKHEIVVAGETIEIRIGNLADQADGAVLVKHGETVVHVAVTSRPATRPDSGFLPLTVDYEERFYARGDILGGQFIRREGKPSDEAILTARLIDRAIRPLFPNAFRDEVQVVATTLALDDSHEPGLLALLGTSIALSISSIPWDGPLGALRIGTREGKWLLNPPATNDPATEFVLAGRAGGIVMVEGCATELNESDIEAAVALALAESEHIEESIREIAKRSGKQKKSVVPPFIPQELSATFDTEILPKLTSGMTAAQSAQNRFARQMFIETLQGEWRRAAQATAPSCPTGVVDRYFEERAAREIRNATLTTGKRLDGRTSTELRPLFAQIGGISSVLHGSGTFYRGATHVVSFLTIGADDDYLAVDGMEVGGQKHFIHHYNFPPFSSGETGRIGSPNRRAIGHGALAERGLRPTLPSRTAFPYTIRVVSEVFASNGSTSMASVCAASMALQDGGVPVKPAAGIALGLLENDSSSMILTDIQGAEDHYGDMDCKIVATSRGITALQLDVKNKGISITVFKKALTQGRTAINTILQTTAAAVGTPRTDLSPAARASLARKKQRP